MKLKNELKNIDIVTSKFYFQKTYIITTRQGKIVVDPGFSFKEINKFLKNSKVLTVLLTHYHFDHVASANKIANKYKTKIFIHKKDYPFLLNDNLSEKYGFPKIKVDKENINTFTSTLPFKDFQCVTISSHSPGSTIFIYKNKYYFSGDLIFLDSVGKIDLPNSDPSKVKVLINFFKKLKNNALILPGHFSYFYSKSLKKRNPFFKDEKWKF